MVRPQSLSDSQILDRVSSVLGDSGTAWSLGSAAAAAGLHSATLIKRFGSRHGLLVALSRRWVDSVPTEPGMVDCHRELLAWIDSLSTHGSTQAQLLARLDMVIEDLRDPELRDLLHEGWQQNLRYLRVLIDGAQEAGQISSATPSLVVAQLLLDSAHGSLLRAAVDPNPTDADPTQTVRNLLEALK